MTQAKQLPGTFPNIKDTSDKRLVLFKKKKPAANDCSSSLATAKAKPASLQKIKHFFEKKQKVSREVVVKESRQQMATWRRWWKSSSNKEQQLQQLTLCKEKQNNKIGSIISVSVPISISNTTHNYYYGSSDDATTTTTKKPSSISTSIVQQLVFLPPLQVYGFMFIVTLLLLVIAFAILQLHRTISIVQTLLSGVSYTVVGLISTFVSTISHIQSLVFRK